MLWLQNTKQPKDKVKQIKEIYILKCLKCGNYTRCTTKYNCWKKYQLCVKCAVKFHPEDYGPKMIGRYVNH